MSASGNEDNRLESAIADVYRGPLEDFVRRRDALAKELRSAGERESASTVKALRKPSRIAWALDLAALDGPKAVDPLVAAVTATLDAQAGGGDVRAAIVGLRGAVREFANRAAHAAQQSGHRIEPAVLANAVLAVLGRQESFDQLRGGSLAAIPEGGGLDFLAGLPTPPESTPAPAKASAPAATRSASAERAGVETAARAAARQAASVLADARARAEAAGRALRDAESKLHAAEARLRRAEEEERTARNEHDRARQEAEAAAGRVLEAETAAADAERRIASTPRASA